MESATTEKMVNKKSKKKGNEKQKGMRKVQKKVQRTASGFQPRRVQAPDLDSVALTHKRMLMDPCRATLGPSTYPGSNGAIVARFEQDQIIFNAATQTAGALVWVPGFAAFAQTPAVAVQDDGSTFNLGPFVGSAGNSFLIQTAGYRCVAACLQVYYPGTEVNRSGIIGMGYGPGTMATAFQTTANGGNNNAASIAQIRQSQFHTERTPQNMVELKWKPGFADQEWESVTSSAVQINTNSATLAGRQAITLTAGGLPPSIGLRVRFISIYEYMPQFGQGTVSTAGNSVITKNTLNDVLMSLEKTGNWFLDTASKYGPTLGSIVGYAGTMLV